MYNAIGVVQHVPTAAPIETLCRFVLESVNQERRFVVTCRSLCPHDQLGLQVDAVYECHVTRCTTGVVQPDAVVRRHHVVHVRTRRRLLPTVHRLSHRPTAPT